MCAIINCNTINEIIQNNKIILYLTFLANLITTGANIKENQLIQK